MRERGGRGVALRVLALLALLGAASLHGDGAVAAVSARPQADVAASASGSEPMAFTRCVNGFAGPYPCRNVNLQSFVPLSAMQCSSGNSLWGWTDPLDGREYALMGCNNGISFVDITIPDVPV
jgi:hypothetical protein